MNCRECGRSVQEGLRFCPGCGTDLPRVEVSWVCPSCGSEIKVRSRLCPMCGEEAVEEGRPARPVRRPKMRKARWSPVAQWWVETTDSPQPAPRAKATPEPAAPVKAPAERVPKPAVVVEMPTEPATEVTPPVELAAEATPPVEPAAEATPPVELAAEATPPVELAAEATPPVELAAEATPPVELAAEATPPVELAAEATSPVELAAEATPPVEPAAEATPPAEPAEAEVVAELVLPAEDRPRPAARRDVEFKPLAERLAKPAAAPVPAARPAAVVDVGSRRPAPGKKRAIRPGLLALTAVVVAGALVAAFLFYLRWGGAGFNFQGLLARAANHPAAALTPQPTEVPEALTPTQAPTETVTPLPTETPVPTKTSVPPASEPLVHAVQSGETLRSIAQRYGVSVTELMQANNLSSDVIRLGQQLVIPGQTQPARETGSSQAATHVVQQGENLAMIARQYGVSLVDLMAANGITDPNLVKVGQELKIPGQAEEGLTSTPAPTEAPTARPTSTAMPTTSETVTVTLTPTAAPYEFVAPNLLDPANGETVDGTEGVVVNWTTVGLLDDRSWYVVKSWPEDPALPTPATIWTRTTAVRIPASYKPAQDATSQHFWWSVTVMRAVEGESPVAISPESEQRWFEWQ